MFQHKSELQTYTSFVPVFSNCVCSLIVSDIRYTRRSGLAVNWSCMSRWSRVLAGCAKDERAAITMSTRKQVIRLSMNAAFRMAGLNCIAEKDSAQLRQN